MGVDTHYPANSIVSCLFWSCKGAFLPRYSKCCSYVISVGDIGRVQFCHSHTNICYTALLLFFFLKRYCFSRKKVLVLWFNPVLRAKCWKAQCYFRRPSTDVSLQITFHPRWKKWKALDVLWHIYQTSGCSYTRAITIISQDYWTLNVLQSLRTHSEQREYNPHAPICSHYAS